MKVKIVNHPKGIKPKIKLTVRRVEPSTWKNLMFDKHHYLTASLNPSCKCLLFEWNGEPVAFAGILNSPRKGVPYGCSVSRIVILPQYQGLGMFKEIMHFLGGVVKSLGDGYELYIKTAHQSAIKSLNNNTDLWQGTSFDGKTRKTECEKNGKYKNHVLRLSACKKYIGEKIDGYQDIMLPIKEMRDLKNKKS